MKTKILRAALFTPGPNGTWGIPLLLWGAPGVAKSAILRQLAAEYAMPIEVLSPACRGEGAFGVTPVPVDGRMTYPRPDWTDRFVEAKRGIVFVDEINLAATHYAGALLGLLSDRVLGSHQLGAGVRIMAAANPIDIAAASGGWDLSPPAANRVGHIDWPCPDVKEWTDWLLGHDDKTGPLLTADQEEARVAAAWTSAWGRARGVIAGFLSAHSTHLHAMPATGGNDSSKAWPSPRTWEYATRAWAAADVHALTEAERDELVGAYVGQGAGGELAEWFTKANLPNAEDLLDGRVTWHHNPARLDVTMAVFGAAVAACVATKDHDLRKKRAEAMWGLLAQAVDTAPDIIVVPAKTLVREKLFTASVKVLSRIGAVLEAANIHASSPVAAAG